MSSEEINVRRFLRLAAVAVEAGGRRSRAARDRADDWRSAGCLVRFVGVDCTTCADETPDGFRFCGASGPTLTGAETPRDVRKVITVLFCDLAGYTSAGVPRAQPAWIGAMVDEDADLRGEPRSNGESGS
jgi:hypothetical protein